MKNFTFPFAIFSCGLFTGVSAAYFSVADFGSIPNQATFLPNLARVEANSYVQKSGGTKSRGPASVPAKVEPVVEPALESQALEQESNDDLWSPENFGSLRIEFYKAQERWFDTKVRSEFKMPHYDYQPRERFTLSSAAAKISNFWRAKVIHRFVSGDTVEFELRYYTGELTVREGGVTSYQIPAFNVSAWRNGTKLSSRNGGGNAPALRYGKEYLFLEDGYSGTSGSPPPQFQYFMAPLPGEGGSAMFLSVALSVWHTTEEVRWEVVPGADLNRFLSDE